MSSKKNNKVERIIKRNNVGKNIRSFISGMLVLVVGGVTFLFMALSAFYTGIINSDRDMKKIVAITNENWENQAALDKQIASLMAENASFSQVLYVDDDLEPILMYGERKPVFSDEEAFGKNPAEVLRENGMFREEVVTSFGLIEDTIFAEIKGLFESINGYESKTLFDWSDTDVKMDVKWIVYKTDIENVNVCVYYKYTLNKLQAAQYNFGRFAFMLLVILCFILLFLFNLLMVRRRRLTNKIVYTDSVTGGKNREYFLDIPLKKLKRNAQYAVAQIRFEKYRNYCTAYGLKQGEKLLETIYYCTKEHLHWKEKVAHLEKADFAILLEYKDRQQLEKRLKNMAADFNKAKQGQHFTFSVGINPILSRKDDMADILTAAGIALSKAGKQNAGIVWFNDAMKEEQIWERRVEDDMEKALINHEFQVYLQPKYSTKKEELAAAEALVRWIHPEFDFISPGKFIPIFETNGFILKLDDYMLREISRLQAQWLKEGKKLVPISVNVSRAHFSMDDLAEHICSIVDEYKVPHEYIELELTESAFFDDKETLLSTVKKLKSYGFRISMDDFGAGYSSLNSLKELPLDIIKLDAEFFRSIDDVDRANAIVGDTIALAKKLGMEIVAEGIETRDQVDFLAGQDCDLIQGFYFAKPLPVAEFTKRAWG